MDVRGTLPSHHPGVSSSEGCKIERVVAGNPKQITPSVWARADDFDALEAAFEADPTVERVTKLSENDEECSYQMGWTGPIELIVGLLTDYQGTITHVTGSNTGWQVRALFPDRKSLSQACDAAQELGLQYDVQALYEPKGSRPHYTGLTDKQRDTLVAAFEAGCFTVPREVTLTEFAEEQDISHQAISEKSDEQQELLLSRRSSLTAMRGMGNMEDRHVDLQFDTVSGFQLRHCVTDRQSR